MATKRTAIETADLSANSTREPFSIGASDMLRGGANEHIEITTGHLTAPVVDPTAKPAKRTRRTAAEPAAVDTE